VTRKTIPAETRDAVLDAAWDLFAETASAEIGMAAIAARAGVSRQTLHLAFGDRAGLLHAMLRRKDRKAPEAAKLYAFGERTIETADEFLALVDAWLDYLPVIYPVGIQLDAESLHDHAAAAAWDDRMKGALLRGFRVRFELLARRDLLAPDWTAARAAEFCWSLVHPVNWRLLVVKCGWSAEEFRRSRREAILRVLFAQEPGTSKSGAA
jgi:AcrR family transcriptional regulator